MSKAFTKEDDDGGFTLGPSSTSTPAWVSARAHSHARERLDRGGLTDTDEARLSAILRAPAVPSAGGAEAAVGAEVRVKGPRGERTVVLASAAEVGLVPNAITTGSPLGHALIGAAVGDEVEVAGPRADASETYEVLSISW